MGRFCYKIIVKLTERVKLHTFWKWLQKWGVRMNASETQKAPQSMGRFLNGMKLKSRENWGYQLKFFGHADRGKPRNIHAPILVFWQLQGHSRARRTDREKHICPANPYPQANEKLSDWKRGFSLNTEKCSEAMSELDDKYINKAIVYKKSAKNAVGLYGERLPLALC